MFTQTYARSRAVSHEPDAHLVARHFRTGVRVLLAVSAIATLFCLLFIQEAAYLAAIPIPVLYVVLVFVNYLEVRSRASNLRTEQQSRLGREELEVDVETVGIVTLMKVLGILAIAALVVASAFVGWQTVGIVATGLFCLLVLILAPYLPLYFSEAERTELEKLKRER